MHTVKGFEAYFCGMKMESACGFGAYLDSTPCQMALFLSANRRQSSRVRMKNLCLGVPVYCRDFR